MAITNELSSEIAAALLSKNKSPSELKQLRDVMLQIHATLQKMQQYTSLKPTEPVAKAAKHGAEEEVK
jgi:predicted transcriptional regulator